MSQEPLTCWVYRSPRTDEIHFYLCAEDDFDVVPEALLSRFGAPGRVVELSLSPQRPLAQEGIPGHPTFTPQARYRNTPPQLIELLPDYPSRIEPPRLTTAFQEPPSECLCCLAYPL
jgi:uncharacterized protein YcgL (UPF0745 family)